MNISEQSLRAMTMAVNDTHRAGMSAMPGAIRDLHGTLATSERTGHSRRMFLQRIGLSSLAVAIGTQVVPVGSLVPARVLASAASGDGMIAGFAQSLELAAVAAYGAAGKSGLVTTREVLDAATMFAGHHQEHADAFGAAAGDAAVSAPNPTVLKMVSDQLGKAKDETAVLEIAFGLEGAAAATYLFALGALESKAALQLTASILPVESQHQVILGSVLGKQVPEFVPTFQTLDDAVNPLDAPAG